MAKNDFQSRAKEAGLAKAHCSELAVEALLRLMEKPLPLRGKARWGSPSGERQMGVLIRHGFARLEDKTQYVATEEGRQWIAKLRAAGIISGITISAPAETALSD